MIICDTFSHRKGVELLKQKKGIYSELKKILDGNSLDFRRDRPSEMRTYLGRKFFDLGWSKNVRVGGSNLTISFLKSRVGVCLQLGNVSRLYADMLKLTFLEHKQKIDTAVIIVPDAVASKEFGVNYANYERLIREYDLFFDILRCPTAIFALSS